MGETSCGCQSRSAIGDETKSESNSGQAETTVVYINSAVMGNGDDKLGANLMGVYLDTLSNFARELSHVILVNSGVKLACRFSSSLEQLENLAGTGVKILSCGTCINHFGLKDDLAVGAISNMMEIQETLLNCEKILTP